jgi:hypothetical protein
MKKILLTVGLIINLIGSQICYANYLDFYILQFAGEIGLLSAGVGRTFARYEIAVMYGVVPAGISRADTIETIALRQAYFFNQKIYIGLNVFHLLGLDYQTGSYRDVPQNYYAIGSIRALANLGFQFKTSNKESIFIESGLSDIWIENSIRNNKTINPINHLSVAIGIRKDF